VGGRLDMATQRQRRYLSRPSLSAVLAWSPHVAGPPRRAGQRWGVTTATRGSRRNDKFCTRNVRASQC